jgi:HAD superfamily hydrolase (TIGR01490 family)
MSAHKKKVAVFDIDGTIFRSSLFIQLMEKLIDEKIFSQSVRRSYEREEKKWLEREGDYQEYVNAMVRTFRKNIKGVYYGDFVDIAEVVVEEQWKHVYRYTRDLIKKLKKQDYFLLALSHSPKTALDKFCHRLGFDKSYGTMYEIGPQDRFTGNKIDEHLMANKANILHRAIEKEGLTLTNSVGVGDTESDIPFLEMITNPICFNPNQKLYKYAKRNKWKIVVERKDVIYEL